ncbi:MAG: RNA-binding protein [Methanomicrobiaceae archaeon]|nr:RNA-binding protein [Methanomicrobiaceae archaeon]
MFSHKIYLGNLDHSLTKEEITDIFSEFGNIQSVKLRAGDGFGFIKYKTLEGAQKAIDAMNGKELHGRTLKVEDARPVRHHISRYLRK